VPLLSPCPWPLRSSRLRLGVLTEWSWASPMRAPTFDLPSKFCSSGDLNRGPPPGEAPASSLPSTNFCSRGDLNLGLSAPFSGVSVRGVDAIEDISDTDSGFSAGSKLSPSSDREGGGKAGAVSGAGVETGDGAVPGDTDLSVGDWLRSCPLSALSRPSSFSSGLAGTGDAADTAGVMD